MSLTLVNRGFQLGDGSLMLVSPTPRLGELAAEISALGPVSATIEPNALHHLGLAAARAAFPGARSFGPRGWGGRTGAAGRRG